MIKRKFDYSNQDKSHIVQRPGLVASLLMDNLVWCWVVNANEPSEIK